MELLTATAYAKHRARLNLPGTTQVAVTKAIQAGRLTEPAVQKNAKGHWEINPQLADIQWEENTRQGNHYFRQPLDIRDPEDPPEPTEPEQPADPGLPAVRGSVSKLSPGGKGMTKAEADRMSAIYKAKRLELILKQEMGQLGLIEEMKREAERCGRELRDSILPLEDRLPPVLATMSDEHEIRNLLKKELRTALRSLL